MPSERLLELESNVELWRVDIDDLHEQDVNARVMDISAFNRLADNIKERGALVESLPYCHRDASGKIHIISGHHRVRAARAANIKQLHVLVDVSEMPRSKIVSKQLAHNAIAGHDDPEMLRQLIQEMNNVDDLLRSFVAPELLPPPPDPINVLPVASIRYDFQLMMFTFLPSQLRDFTQLLDLLHTNNDFVGVAPLENYEAFHDALLRYQKARDVRAIGAAIAYLTSTALREQQLYTGMEPDEDEGDVWLSLASVAESATIPLSAARVIKRALDHMQRHGYVSEKNRWQGLEYLAAEYLSANLVPDEEPELVTADAERATALR